MYMYVCYNCFKSANGKVQFTQGVTVLYCFFFFLNLHILLANNYSQIHEKLQPAKTVVLLCSRPEWTAVFAGQENCEENYLFLANIEQNSHYHTKLIVIPTSVTTVICHLTVININVTHQIIFFSFYFPACILCSASSG